MKIELRKITSVEEIKTGMTLYTSDVYGFTSIETVECIDNGRLFSVDLETGERHEAGRGEPLEGYLESYDAVYIVEGK